MDRVEIVIVSPPGVSHLQSAVEVAKRLVGQNNLLRATVLILKLPNDPKHHEYVESLYSSIITDHIGHILLPIHEVDLPNAPCFFTALIERNLCHIREAIRNHVKLNSFRVGGLLVDMFCTLVIDIANELNLPSYVFIPSNASFLGLMFHLEKLVEEQGVDFSKFKDDPHGHLDFPCFVNRLPHKVLPNVMLMNDSGSIYARHAKRFRETKAIIVNTVMELEPHIMKTLIDDDKIPPVYPVGPIINIKKESDPNPNENVRKVTEWLDSQPDLSVVFLCFGSIGNFKDDQLKEIGQALENCGHSFLWSVRKGSKITFKSEDADFQDILPKDFFERMAGRGKVIGWAPQVEILAHRAIGGFVSHCGWNSTLESLWFGVPIATWPLYAEQQLNAFLLAVELELGVEIKMDFRWGVRIRSEELVTADEIEKGIRMLMLATDERKKVKETGEKIRMASVEGGSSYASLNNFINCVLENIPPESALKKRKYSSS